MSVMTNSVGISVGNETVGSSFKSAGSEVAESAVEASGSVVFVDESSPPQAAIKRVDESVSARRARDVRDDIFNTLAVLS
jgi:hypothetical protein